MHLTIVELSFDIPARPPIPELIFAVCIKDSTIENYGPYSSCCSIAKPWVELGSDIRSMNGYIHT